MKSFLGKGWRYPVEIDRSGGVAYTEHEESIRQAIFIILGTALGERVMRPHFGCEIHELVFAPNNLHTATLGATFCLEALTKWEPRIEEIETDAEPSKSDPNRLDVHIKYKIRG